jgi:hypothetical protein
MNLNQPRGDMLGWDEFDDDVIEAPDGVKLAGGFLVQDNQSINRSTKVGNPLHYSWQEPLRNLYAPNKADEYELATPERNFGYGALYGDEELRREIARASHMTNVPGRWIADSLAMITRGTFSPYSEAGAGAFGFVAKTPRDVMGMDINPLLYSQGDIHTQMDAVIKQLQKSQVAEEGAEYTLTSILNPEVAQRSYDNPLISRSLNNGVYTLEDIWNKLGSHQDIAYNHALNNRRIAVNSHKHDGFNPQCAWCLSLAQARTDIVPHEFQSVTNF